MSTSQLHPRQHHGRPRRYCRTDPEPLNEILIGDALEQLRSLPNAYVDCVITSPPYHLLRRYDAGGAEMGIETHVNDYVAHLLAVLDEVARVLTPTGGLWLNLGDSFSRGDKYGAPAKSLLLAPERILLALSERGWIVRNKIVWAKPNPMPSSVGDRLTTTWEPMYFLVRARDHFFDLDAIREPHRTQRKPGPLTNDKYGGRRPTWAGPLAGINDGLRRAAAEGRPGHPLGKNPGDVWTVSTAGYRGAHFAVFPSELIRRPLIAGCPERTCRACNRPWRRERRRDRLGGLKPTCNCDDGWRPGRVLDPFVGSGTVPALATELGRDWLGIELNPAYLPLIEERLAKSAARSRSPPGDRPHANTATKRKESSP